MSAIAGGPLSLAAKPCCQQSAELPARSTDPVIALVGAPNVGKSTLFNALTGARATMGNWPGTTVAVSRGTWRYRLDAKTCDCDDCQCASSRSSTPAPAEDASVISAQPVLGRANQEASTTKRRPNQATIIDLPGSYSLNSVSPDEQLTRQLIVDAPAGEAPDLTVVLVDAAHLARSLYLVSQLRETPRRLVLAVTMDDIARRHGIEVDSHALSEVAGVPVIMVDPRHRAGLDNLTRAIVDHLYQPVTPARVVRELATRSVDPGTQADGLALPAEPGQAGQADGPAQTADPDAATAGPAAEPDPTTNFDADDERFGWIASVIERGTKSSGETSVRRSDKIDRLILAPLLGPVIFLALMWLVFQITTVVAAPLQDGLDALFSGPVTEGAEWLLDAAGLGGSWVEGLIVDGLIAGVGALLTFVPLMTLMFILLALLEDSGYLARAAVLTDRVMSRLGLPGRAFLPIVVGFGCNVPGIAATRAMPNARHRLLTVLLIPFTSCTARLTVFVMLANVFFDTWLQGTVIFLTYVASILLVILVGLPLRRVLWRRLDSEPLIIDLPPYQTPTVRLTLTVTWVRLKGFLATAGGIIVVTVAIVWLLQSIPSPGIAGIFGQVAVEDSLYAGLAKWLTPLFAPAGFGTWETVAALIVGFVAKEAVISSWAQTYAIAEESSQFAEHVRLAFENSSGGHPVAAVAAFMIFFLAYTPCVATLAAQRREIGWKWTGIGIALQLVVAYVLAVVVFQVAS